MSLDADQSYKLEQTFEAAKEKFDDLSEWEQGFIVSTEERYNLYKAETRLSVKQWAVIDRIYDKVMAE